MEREYRNAGDATLTWVYLQRPDGRTLELEPGEVVTLDLPDDFSDSLLVPVTVSESPKRARAKAVTFPPFAPPMEQEQVENA